MNAKAPSNVSMVLSSEVASGSLPVVASEIVQPRSLSRFTQQVLWHSPHDASGRHTSTLMACGRDRPLFAKESRTRDYLDVTVRKA